MDGGKGGGATMNDQYFDVALEQELDVAEEKIISWVLEGEQPDLALFSEVVAIGLGPEAPETHLLPHQFTQLMTVARDSASVAVVVNYLRYQIGRAPGENVGWRWHHIGEQIVALLKHQIRDQAHSAAQRAAERVRGPGVGAREDELRWAWVQLTRRFLAMLRRRFVQRIRDLGYQQEEAA
jgi:hypothetical protein